MKIDYLNQEGDFRVKDADEKSYLYFPIANEEGVKASITPTLHGDSKLNQNAFFLEPVSSENLHTTNMGRNMWFTINDETHWAINGCSPMQQMSKLTKEMEDKKDEVEITGGHLWHSLCRKNNALNVEATILSYAPIAFKAEVMRVTIKNTSNDRMKLKPTVAVPIYGRSAENYRDHRHVTSLLHRIYVKENGIEVNPTLSFDERGHLLNDTCYGVYAIDEKGNNPTSFYPVLEEFVGEGSNLNYPKTIVNPSNHAIYQPGDQVDGFEAIGAMSFEPVYLEAGQTYTYIIILSYNKEGLEILDYKMEKNVFNLTKEFWKEQSSIRSKTGDMRFDNWLRWVGLQPKLRRIYGCSFLPHHDYGRGGRGYRDLWQDSLALLLLSRENIKDNLVNYYAGVRIDGSNATIIGNGEKEFIADRNSIVRMWMDHGYWPFLTTMLYINQTGDADILFENTTYFKDAIIGRGTKKDGLWDENVHELRTFSNQIYQGTILEHILVQNLTVYFDVGSHGHMKLRDADWNDALDMAKENGESVAFSAAYAGNLQNIANLSETYQKRRLLLRKIYVRKS